MNYFNQCLQKFRSLPKELQLRVGSLEAVKIINILEVKYHIKLGFLVVLVTIGELQMEDIENYLQKKYQLSPSAASDINRQLQEKIFGPAVDLMLQLVATTPTATPAEIQASVIEAFKIRLVDLLTLERNLAASANIIILSIIAAEVDKENDFFEEKLERALYDNQEVMTKEPFVLVNKDVPATVGNWIADFIAYNGTAYFDAMKISDYLVSSPNAKKLDKTEKELVARLLNLYRNVKFFPQSLANIEPENWQIIPLPAGAEITKKTTKSSAATGDLTPLELRALQESERNKK